MKKGASQAVLKIVERELHEAWRKGYEEGRREVAESAVPEILTARFGPEARAPGAAVVKFMPADELAELVVLAATCPDFPSFYRVILPRKRKQKS